MNQTPSGNRWESAQDDTAPVAGAGAGARVAGPPACAPATSASNASSAAATSPAAARPVMTYEPAAPTVIETDAEPATPLSAPSDASAAPRRGLRGRWRSVRRRTRVGLVAVLALLLALGLFGAGFATGRVSAPDSGTGDTPVNQLDPDGDGFRHGHGGPGFMPPDQGQLPDQGTPAQPGTDSGTSSGANGSTTSFMVPGSTTS